MDKRIFRRSPADSGWLELVGGKELGLRRTAKLFAFSSHCLARGLARS